MQNNVRQLQKITNLNLRKTSQFYSSNSKIIKEAIALFPKETSDPVIDNLFGTEIINIKTHRLKEDLLKTSTERTNDNLRTLYTKLKSNIRGYSEMPNWVNFECMSGEDLKLKEKMFEYNWNGNGNMKTDFMLTAIPNRLARFREPSFLIENNKKVFYGENICLLYTSPSPRDLSTSRMPSSA